LAIGVAVALIAGVLAVELSPGKVTAEEAGFLSTLGGAAIGALAAYLGSHRRDDDDDDKKR
jgi:hypothetical protein